MCAPIEKNGDAQNEYQTQAIHGLHSCSLLGNKSRPCAGERGHPRAVDGSTNEQYYRAPSAHWTPIGVTQDSGTHLDNAIDAATSASEG